MMDTGHLAGHRFRVSWRTPSKIILDIALGTGGMATLLRNLARDGGRITPDSSSVRRAYMVESQAYRGRLSAHLLNPRAARLELTRLGPATGDSPPTTLTGAILSFIIGVSALSLGTAQPETAMHLGVAAGAIGDALERVWVDSNGGGSGCPRTAPPPSPRDERQVNQAPPSTPYGSPSVGPGRGAGSARRKL